MYTCQQIANLIGVTLKGQYSEQLRSSFFVDSRNAPKDKSAVFFALTGEVHDGHHYIEELIKKGFSCFVVEHVDEKLAHKANFIVVNNTLKAMQKLAAKHRAGFEFEVYAITGSNGKTTVKEWLYQCLWTKMKVLRSPASYNSQVGVPLAILNTSKQGDIGFFEAGISKPSEMHLLEEILKPNKGVFTSIGMAHQQGFSSVEEKIDEKFKLFKGVEKLYANASDQRVAQKLEDHNCVSFAYNHKQCTEPIEVKMHADHFTEVCVKGIWFELPFLDQASIDNAVLCILILKDLGLSDAEIQEKVSALNALEMRLSIKPARNQNILIDDAYSADVEALKNALGFLERYDKKAQKVLVLSELIDQFDDLQQYLMTIEQVLSTTDLDHIVLVGSRYKHHQFSFEEKCTKFSDTQALLKGFDNLNIQSSIILVKGARSFKFEQFVQHHQIKTQQSVLEIDLKALEHNLQQYRSLLHKDQKLMVMLKAFAYGAGPFEMAKVLEYNKVDYIGVAYVDEGVELREKGIDLPIMVMHVLHSEFSRCIEYDLEPVISSIDAMQALVRFTNNNHCSCNLHLELETGMKRLGVSIDQIQAFIPLLLNAKQLTMQSVFTHLVASEDEGQDAFTQWQIERYSKAVEQIKQNYQADFDTHVFNSAGIERFNDQHAFSMVRLGLGLYGLSRSKTLQLELLSSLKTSISQIHELKKGESVGYNRAFVCDRPMRVATLPIGYADGILRALGNKKGVVYIDGKPCAILGNVCMDMCMIDITDLEQVYVGKPVVVFESSDQLLQMARAASTIVYEILTGISARVKRAYLH